MEAIPNKASGRHAAALARRRGKAPEARRDQGLTKERRWAEVVDAPLRHA
jgi:hypothetical protein